MKSLPFPLGWVNLKGKRSRVLRCGCCICQNLKPREETKRIKKEIKREYGLMAR